MIEGVVHADGRKTRFRRGGRGPQLLLLASGEDADWAAGITMSLMERFRVFVPELPSALVAFLDPGP